MSTFYTIYKDFYMFDLAKHPLFVALLVLVVTDITLGFARGWATNTWDSKIARMGIVSHFTIIAALTLAYPTAVYFGFGVMTDVFVGGFCLSYLSSVIANWVAVGGKIPAKLRPLLEEKLDHEINKHKQKGGINE